MMRSWKVHYSITSNNGGNFHNSGDLFLVADTPTEAKRKAIIEVGKVHLGYRLNLSTQRSYGRLTQEELLLPMMTAQDRQDLIDLLRKG